MECCGSLIFAILAGFVGVLYLLYRQVTFFERKGVPYVKSLPLIGSMAQNILRRISFAEAIQNLYNARTDVRYVGIFDLGSPTVLLRDPELIKSVTIKNFDNFKNHRNFLNEDLDPLFAKNLFLLQGERWREWRSLLSPTFTSSKMKMMFKLVSQCGIDLADHLTAQASTPIDIEMKDTFTRYTNDVIATSAFGISVNSLKDRENKFYLMGKKATAPTKARFARLLALRVSPFLGRLFKLRFIEHDVSQFFSSVIESTIAMRDEKGIVRNDMIQLMLQARDRSEKIKLTTLDMTAQAFIFFFGGFDTSSTLMCFATHEVALNPAVQEKLQAEIDAVLEECEGEVTYEALHTMQYLDAVVNEALRLYPPFSSVDRMCNTSFELPPAAPGLPPFVVEAGMSSWIPIFGLHRDPQYYPDPDRFDPERFSEENKARIPPFAFLPFGLGPRSCIANRFALMETKVALFYLFAKCTLSRSSKTTIPVVLDKSSFNTTAESGFWLKIQRRGV